MFKTANEAEILQYQYSTTYFSNKNDVKAIKRLNWFTIISINILQVFLSIISLSIFLYIIKQAYWLVSMIYSKP